MIFPLVPVLIAFISGILLEFHLHVRLPYFSTYALPLLVIFYVTMAGLCYFSIRLRHRRLATLLLMLSALLAGMTRYATATYLPDHHLEHLLQDELVTVEGFIDQPVRTFGKKRYLDIQVNRLEKGRRRYETCGRIRIVLTGASFPDSGKKELSYGTALRTRLRLRRPKNFGNFDYRAYLRRQGIYRIGTLRHDRYLIVLPQQQGRRVLRGMSACQRLMQQFLDDAQAYAPFTLTVFPTISSEQAIQVIKAMTLGITHVLDSELKEKVRLAGLYHFLVVSGIHIGILVWVLHKISNFCLIPLRYRSLPVSAALLFYAGITGFHFPVLRAVIMAVIFYFAITCNRIADSLYSLLCSIAVILVLFPASLFEISFQLTVTATASILLFFRFLHNRPSLARLSDSPWFVRIPLTIILTTCGALLGVAPLLIYYFGECSPYSFFSNPLAFPIVSILLPCSLGTNFLALLVPRGIFLSLCLSVNIVFAKMFIALSSWFPDTMIGLPTPSKTMLVLYYAIVFGLLGYIGKTAR